MRRSAMVNLIVESCFFAKALLSPLTFILSPLRGEGRVRGDSDGYQLRRTSFSI
jgi:hypothetical protein